MATSRVSFTTETLAILNMLESGETINYDWAVDEDYSIVLAEGSIDVNQTILTGVAEHRIQPNTYLTATCISSERAYFITLFDATRDGLIDQIISSTSKTKLRSYAPYWYDEGMSLMNLCILMEGSPGEPDDIQRWRETRLAEESRQKSEASLNR